MFSNFYLLILLAILKNGMCLFWHNHHQNGEEAQEKNEVHTIPLGSGATFHWRYIYKIIIHWCAKLKNHFFDSKLLIFEQL